MKLPLGFQWGERERGEEGVDGRSQPSVLTPRIQVKNSQRRVRGSIPCCSTPGVLLLGSLWIPLFSSVCPSLSLCMCSSLWCFLCSPSFSSEGREGSVPPVARSLPLSAHFPFPGSLSSVRMPFPPLGGGLVHIFSPASPFPRSQRQAHWSHLSVCWSWDALPRESSMDGALLPDTPKLGAGGRGSFSP